MKVSLIAATASAALLLSSAFGQIATNTSLVGSVADQSGKVVAGAKVIATNTGTQETYSATTNQEGYYALQFIKIGTYDLSVSSPGFQTYKKVGILVEINQVVRNDIPLKVGDVVQSMTVEASTPAIQTDDLSISEVINTKSVADLPLNGRDPLRLAITTPGVLPGLKAANGIPPGQDFIGACTREITNSLSLDGISIMNNLITTSSFRPSVDSVQEFQVQNSASPVDCSSWRVTRGRTRSTSPAIPTVAASPWILTTGVAIMATPTGMSGTVSLAASTTICLSLKPREGS